MKAYSLIIKLGIVLALLPLIYHLSAEATIDYMLIRTGVLFIGSIAIMSAAYRIVRKISETAKEELIKKAVAAMAPESPEAANKSGNAASVKN